MEHTMSISGSSHIQKRLCRTTATTAGYLALYLLLLSHLNSPPQLWRSQVFTCMYAHYLALGLDLRFSAANMPTFREKMTLSILRGALS